jgi:hypothetical protein
LVGVSEERVQRLALGVEGDMPARNLLPAKLWRHELKEDARTARFGVIFGIIIHAAWGIFENEWLPPGLARRAAVAAFFQEREFCFKDIQ